jgi:hypothetical protein
VEVRILPFLYSLFLRGPINQPYETLGGRFTGIIPPDWLERGFNSHSLIEIGMEYGFDSRL